MHYYLLYLWPDVNEFSFESQSKKAKKMILRTVSIESVDLYCLWTNSFNTPFYRTGSNLKSTLYTRIIFIGILSLTFSFITTPSISHTFPSVTASSQSVGNATRSNQPGEIAIGALQDLATTLKQPAGAMDVKMAQISSSNKPEDIATLANIWGFPLITMERQFNFVTSPNIPPGLGRGPANSISCAQDLANASFTDVVSPNSDTLYCQVQFDLTNEPLVIVVPP